MSGEILQENGTIWTLCGISTEGLTISDDTVKLSIWSINVLSGISNLNGRRKY